MAVIKKYLNIGIQFIIGVFALLFLVYLLFRSPVIQTHIVQYVTAEIKERTGADITVGAVDFRFMDSFILKDLLIMDFRNDTLLACRELQARVDSFSLFRRGFVIRELTLDELFFDLYMERREPISLMNIEVLLDSLNKLSSTTNETSTSSSWQINLERIKIKNSRFIYQEQEKDQVDYGVNWTNIDCRDLNLTLSGFKSQDSVFYMQIENLSLREKSGLTITNIAGLAAFKSGNLIVTDAEVALANSRLDLRKLEYTWTPDNQDWRNFVTRMQQYYELGPSTVSFTDLAYFNDNVLGMDNVARCQGIVFNTVHQIQGKDLRIDIGDYSYLEGEFKSWGLPNVFDTHFEVKLSKARIAPVDLETIYLPWMDYRIELPSLLHKMPYVDFKALNFTGKLEDFSLHAIVQDFNVKGNILFNLKEQEDERMDMSGNFNFHDLNTRLFAGNNLLNRAAIKGTYSAYWNDALSINVDAESNKLHIGKSSLTNIRTRLDYEPESWNMEVNVVDSLAQAFMTFYGEDNSIYSYGDIAIPQTHAFLAIDSLFHGKLSFIYNMDHIERGNDGRHTLLTIDSLYFANKMQDCLIDSIHIDNLIHNNNVIHTQLESDVIDLRINGNYWGVSPFIVARNVLNHYFPFVEKKYHATKGIRNREEYNIRYDAKLKDMNKVFQLIYPQLSIPGKAELIADLNESDLTAKIVLRADSLRYNDVLFSFPSFELYGDGNKLSSTCRLRKISYNDRYNLYNLYGDLTLSDNCLNQRLTWCNWEDRTFSGELSTTTSLIKNQNNEIDAHIQLHPSVLIVNDTIWQINAASLYWSKDFLRVDTMIMNCDQQKLMLEGCFSSRDEDRLKLSISNFNLLNWSKLLLEDEIGGMASGELILKKGMFNKFILADLNINNCGLGNEALGDIAIRSFWDAQRDRVMLKAENVYAGKNPFTITGYYKPTTDSLNMAISLNEIILKRFEPHFKNNITNLQGALSGAIQVAGTLNAPLCNGKLYADTVAVYLNALNSTMRLNDSILISNNTFVCNDLIIRDSQQGIAAITGSYDPMNSQLNIDTRFDNFALMNTTGKHNELFYGQLNISGSLLINQEQNKSMIITVNMRPERESHIYIPMSASGTETHSDFLHFVDLNKSVVIEEVKKQIYVEEGIHLNANIELNNNLDVDVIFDPTVGDILKTNGLGNIKLTLDEDGILNMFGNYEISKGDYLFTLSNLLNKRFTLSSGGKITWAGSPFDATIDVNAVYGIKTTLNELLGESEGNKNNESGVERGKKVPVECILNLSDRLANPNVKFSIAFPSLESQTRSYIESLFASQDEINKQVFSLLLLNRFYRTNEDLNQYGEKAGMASITTVTEMVSGQLSRWLSQISNNLDIGLSYRVGEDEITADEIEVALSTQLLNDRITISANGNMDVGNKHTPTTNSTNIAGDFDVDVKLNPQGTLKLKAYSHTNEKILYNNTETIQGIGVSYQERFDTLKELIRKYFRFLYKKENEFE